MHSKEKLKSIAKGESKYLPERFIYKGTVVKNDSPGIVTTENAFLLFYKDINQHKQQGLKVIDSIPENVFVLVIEKTYE